MSFQLNITPEDIESLVKDSLVKAGLGKTIQDATAKALSGYDSPIDKAVRQYIGDIASDLIREKYADQVRDAVSRHIEALITQDLIDKTVDVAINKMVKAVDSYY